MQQRIAKYEGASRREACQGLAATEKVAVRKEVDQLLVGGYLRCIASESESLKELVTPKARPSAQTSLDSIFTPIKKRDAPRTTQDADPAKRRLF